MGDYRQEFKRSANAQIIPEAKKREVVVQANVVGVGVMSVQRNSASVMVYMNRTVTDKSRQPLYDGSRTTRPLPGSPGRSTAHWSAEPGR